MLAFTHQRTRDRLGRCIRHPVRAHRPLALRRRAQARTFERALDVIETSDAGYHEPRAGEVQQSGSVHVEVVNFAELTGDMHEGCLGALPAGTRPGTLLKVRFRGDELVEATVDVEETERARQRVREKMQRLRRRGRRL